MTSATNTKSDQQFQGTKARYTLATKKFDHIGDKVDCIGNKVNRVDNNVDRDKLSRLSCCQFGNKSICEPVAKTAL